MDSNGLRIGLVTPVLNNFKGYCQLIGSLRGRLIHPIIVPNWAQNRGVAPAWNWGIKKAFELGCSHVLVTNDDIVISKELPDILAARLTKSMFEGDNVILASGRNVRGNPAFDGTMEGLEAMRPPADYAGEVEGDSPDFSCFMVTPRTIQEIGWFDQNFRPAYFEDNDYHYRIHLAGFKTANMAHAPIYHVGSQTQNNPANKGPVVTGQMFDANRQYYRAKWGGNPGEEKFKTPFNHHQSFKDWFPEDRQGY